MFKTIHNMKVRDERGFTLVELLIVIAIIAILAAIAIPQFAAYRQRGVRASMVADAKNVATMLEAYFADNQSYVGGGPVTGQFTFITPQTGRMSTGNSLTVTGGATSYNIVVSNPAGGTGSDDYSLSSSGATAFY